MPGRGHNLIRLGGNDAYGASHPVAAFGGDDGDILVGDGTLENLVAGPGAETLFGSGFRMEFFAGPGPDFIAMQGPSESTYMGTGAASITAYGTAETIAFDPAHAGGSAVITGFYPALSDRLDVSAYGPGAVAAALGSARVAAGSETLTLSDGTRITLVGVTTLDAGAFTGG